MAQVLLDLPDDVLQRAESEARRSHRSTEALLTEALVTRLRLPEEGSRMDPERWDDVDLSGLSDEMLQAHIRTPVPAEFVRRMDELSKRNTGGTITADERAELERMVRVVQSGTILQALALVAWEKRHGSLPDQSFESCGPVARAGSR